MLSYMVADIPVGCHSNTDLLTFGSNTVAVEMFAVCSCRGLGASVVYSLWVLLEDLSKSSLRLLMI